MSKTEREHHHADRSDKKQTMSELKGNETFVSPWSLPKNLSEKQAKIGPQNSNANESDTWVPTITWKWKSLYSTAI